MVGDADPMVRYQLAFSLGRCRATGPRRRWRRWRSATGPIPGCGWRSSSSVTHCTGEVFTRLAADAGFRASAHGRAFLTALVGQTGAADVPTTWPRSSRRWMARWPASRPWPAASSWP